MRHVFALLIAAALCAAQDGVPVHLLVTVEGEHGRPAPEVTQQDVMVTSGKDRLSVTGWTQVPPLRLVVLIDDDANSDLSLQFGDLKNFLAALPQGADVSIEYMRNGTTQPSKTLRLPMGPSSGGASPYMSLQEVVKKWPPGNVRREVLMVSSGIDPYYSVGPENPYLASAIAEAQKAGVVVHSIYFGSGGHLGHSFARSTWGQSYLSMLGDQTGGEAYWEGSSNAISFQPYLKDLTARLNHQYMLTFMAHPGRKSELRPVKVRTEVKGAELVSADRAWVPGDR